MPLYAVNWHPAHFDASVFVPAVVAVSESGAHVMLRRQTVDDLLNLDVSE